jgi:hypothetical protein
MPLPVGYRIVVRLEPMPDTAARRLSVSKFCTYYIHGRPNTLGGFMQGAQWEIRRRGREWTVVTLLARMTT